jgi:membrane protein implicated in regulation of membrane protease activity
MDIVLSLFSIIFIAMLLTVAVTFGFAILTFFVAIALVTALLITGREVWRRWRFVRNANQPQERTHVIEGEYEVITHEEKKERL